jgi:hypothetical protein
MKVEWMEWDGAKLVKVPGTDTWEALLRISIDGADVENIRNLNLDKALHELRNDIRTHINTLLDKV